MGTKIYNSALTNELRDGAKIQTSMDPTPSEIADKVVPVMEVNPKMMRRTNFVKNTVTSLTGAITIYTTPTDKDFLLTGAHLAYIKDVASDGTDCYLQAILADGTTVQIIQLPGITATAQSDSLGVTLANPALLKKGSIISVVGNTTAGVFRKSATIYGYTVDNINA